MRIVEVEIMGIERRWLMARQNRALVKMPSSRANEKLSVSQTYVARIG